MQEIWRKHPPTQTLYAPSLCLWHTQQWQHLEIPKFYAAYILLGSSSLSAAMTFHIESTTVSVIELVTIPMPVSPSVVSWITAFHILNCWICPNQTASEMMTLSIEFLMDIAVAWFSNQLRDRSVWPKHLRQKTQNHWPPLRWFCMVDSISILKCFKHFNSATWHLELCDKW